MAFPARIRKKSNSELSKWRRKAKTAIQKYRRLLDADKYGDVQCPTCSNRYAWNDPQGRTHGRHFIPAERGNTCFDIRNIFSGCGWCNKTKDHDVVALDVLAIHIDRQYGEGTVDELKLKSQITKKYNVFELMAIHQHWTEEFDKLYKTKVLGRPPA